LNKIWHSVDPRACNGWASEACTVFRIDGGHDQRHYNWDSNQSTIDKQVGL
jgi:hypothetical protein